MLVVWVVSESEYKCCAKLTVVGKYKTDETLRHHPIPASIFLQQHPQRPLTLLCMGEMDLGRLGVVQRIRQISNPQKRYIVGGPNAKVHLSL